MGLELEYEQAYDTWALLTWVGPERPYGHESPSPQLTSVTISLAWADTVLFQY